MVAALEAPFALFQEPVKVFGLNAVEPAQMPLCLVSKIFSPIDMVAMFGK